VARRTLLARLGSPRFAAILMGVSIALLMLAVIVPQRSFLGAGFAEFAEDQPALAAAARATGLDRIFDGWIVAAVTALLVINVTACTLIRVRRRRPSVRHLSVVDRRLVTDRSPGEITAECERRLRSAGWRVMREGEQLLSADRGSSGFWGSVVLHVSILVIAAGGVASTFMTFAGEMLIADGQTVIDEPRAYLTISREPRVGTPYTGSAVSLDRTEVAYEDGILVRAVASMRAVDPSGRVVTKDVSVNHPLDVAGRSFLLMESGLAARLLMPVGADGGKREVTVNLGEKTPHGWQDALEVRRADGTTATVELVAMPVPLEPGQELPREQLALTDPHLFARVRVQDEVIDEGLLAPGQRVDLGDGADIGFSDVVLWSRFLVRGDHGRWIAYVGFWLAVTGAAWRFGAAHREITIRCDPGESAVTIGFRSRPWPGLAQSSDEALVERLAEWVTARDADQG
jgi:cytochrome c biogenesis protein ResB